MRKERASDIIRKNLSAAYSTLLTEKEVSLALSKALQVEIEKNSILTEQLNEAKLWGSPQKFDLGGFVT